MASTATKELQDGFLSTTRQGQEIVLEAIRTWVDTVQAVTPKVPAVQLPFAGQLPRPQDVVASAYDFAGQVLASQRKFAEEVLKTAAPLLPGTAQAAK
ncbi:MAG: hypothetical protein ACRDOB_27740 [Streptosporangiaceae bacterium]